MVYSSSLDYYSTINVYVGEEGDKRFSNRAENYTLANF